MELNKLATFVVMVVAVGMLIGVGLVTFEKFGSSTYYSRTGQNDSVTIGANNTAVTFDFGNVTVSQVWNGTTNLMSSDCYVVNAVEGFYNFTNTSENCDEIPQTSYVIYDWKDYNTETAAALANVSTETARIPSDWIGLIITVVILSIILVLVIRSFGQAR